MTNKKHISYKNNPPSIGDILVFQLSKNTIPYMEDRYTTVILDFTSDDLIVLYDVNNNEIFNMNINWFFDKNISTNTTCRKNIDFVELISC